jgi:hypothetical protein
MPRAELARAASREVEVREVAQNPRLLELLALAADRTHVHAGGFADTIVAFAWIADQMADDEPLLVI